MKFKSIFGSACLLVFASFVSTAQAGFTMLSDFNSNTGDIGFNQYNPLGGGTWSFPNGGYQITAAASPNPLVLGAGRAGSFPAGSFADVKLNWDLVDWDDSLDQAFGGAVRVNEIGPGTFDGYLFVYNTSEWQPGTSSSSIRIGRIENSRGFLLDRSDIELDPTKDYRFEFTAVGNNFTGQVFDLEDLTTALASVQATDSTYAAGQTALLVINWNDQLNGPADATFDNFRAEVVPEPTSLMLGAISLTGLAGWCRRRKKAMRR